MQTVATNARDPVDEILPAPRLLTLGLQHVLVMYAGAVAVPLIIGRALKLSPEQVALLINADLFCCGIVTLLQSFGAGPLFGIRMPVMMGVTFVAVGPMVAMAGDPNIGILGIFGAVIASGAFAMFVAQDIGFLLPLFPPLVTGTIIFMIGVTLMRVGVNWAAGAPVDTMPGYGDPLHLALAAFVLVTILLITKYGRGFFANIAVLLGIVIGCAVAGLLGRMSLAKVASAGWFGLITPFQFGTPVFEPSAVIPMCIVMVVVMIESAGMFLALGEMTGRAVDREAITRGLRVDGLGTLIGGVFNTFPYTSFSQNIGLVGVTGVKSRYVCVAGGLMLMLMGLVPKLGALVEAVPTFVLGGAGLVMFGMVAATGVRILAGSDLKTNAGSRMVVGVSCGLGLVPLINPLLFAALPKQLGPFLHSGILITAVSAVTLNLIYNGWAVRGHATPGHALQTSAIEADVLPPVAVLASAPVASAQPEADRRARRQFRRRTLSKVST